ncbi:putative amino acid permease, partial [Streptococcus dysgalactiae subsp. equisimilis]
PSIFGNNVDSNH